jgi:hypothetical protein
MFDWFRNYNKPKGSIAEDMKAISNDMSNVFNLPAPKLVPPLPEVKPPEPEAKIFYRIGATDKNRVAFSMGHMEITMNKDGCQNMIDQLTVFMNQLDDEVEDEEV